MNREIKFRAMKDDMSNPQWVYGDLVRINQDIPRIKTPGLWLFTYCIKGTEGQYTGLQDKNGKDIYEGDVIKVWTKDKEGYDYNGEVVYVSGSFYFGIGDEFPFNKILGLWNKDSEVIGNVHETPNLLT